MSKKQYPSDKTKKTTGKKEERTGQKGFKKFFKEGPEKSSGHREDRPDRKTPASEEKRYRSSERDAPRSPRGGSRKDEKPFKRSSGDGDYSGKREGGQSSRGAFRRDEQPFKRSSGDGDYSGKREGRPSSRGTYRKDEKPFKRSSGDGDYSGKREGGSASRGTYRKDEKPFKRSSGDGDYSGKREGGQSSRGTYRKDEKPFKRSSGDGDYSGKREGGPSSRGAYRKDEKPFRKTSGDNDFSRPGKERSFEKSDKRADKHKEPSRPNRYAHAFGKLDDEELAAHQQKLKDKKAEREQGDDVSFSKSLDKWEAAADEVHAEKEARPFTRRKDMDTADQPRHNKKDKFKRNFDNENDYEKAYAAKADGRAGKRKVIEIDDEEDEEDEERTESGKMPLNKYIAHCDVCSRRDAVSLIKDGKVKVNGVVITEPGYKVSDGEEITLNDKKLAVQKNLVYILLNKPKGYITTTDDPKGRKTVMDIVQNYIDERVFPIGRLDRNTTGLLLLTNDGEFAQKLSHPKYEIKKVYQVKLDKALAKTDFDKIVAGLTLEDGPVSVDAIEYLDTKEEIGLEIHSGKNRIVRRIFESLGYEVEKLDRVMYAGLTKKNVLRGKWRFLTKQEVINLKHFK